jgi:hypothetical protein
VNNIQWVPMKEAAKILKISRYKLSQLVLAGKIQTKENIQDNRAKLINIEQAKKVLELS